MTRLQTVVGAALAVLFLAAIAALTKTEPVSWNDRSRIAAIESLVERGTWAIDGSQWLTLTQDKVYLGGRFYSDKMPLFSVLGAGVYAVLHMGWGASLAPDCADVGRFCGYPGLTFALVGLPVTALLWLFYRHALGLRPLGMAVLATAALGLGTMILPYALVFNHHAPAAASLFAAFVLLRRGGNSRGALAGAGLLTALAVSFDALSGLIAASVFAIALVRSGRRIAWFAIGAAAPILLTAWLDFQISQSIVPPYMITNGYDYEGSAFPATVGGNGTPDDYPAYAFRMFLGGQGLFAFNPLLLFALAGALGVAARRGHPLRVEGAFAALGFIGLCVYLAVGTGNYGGTAYGERWFVPAIPILFSFILFVPPLNGAGWKNPAWILFLPLLGLSVLSTLQGAQAPWGYTPPPLQITRQAQFPVFGLKWNFKWP